MKGTSPTRTFVALLVLAAAWTTAFAAPAATHAESGGSTLFNPGTTGTTGSSGTTGPTSTSPSGGTDYSGGADPQAGPRPAKARRAAGAGLVPGLEDDRGRVQHASHRDLPGQRPLALRARATRARAAGSRCAAALQPRPQAHGDVTHLHPQRSRRKEDDTAGELQVPPHGGRPRRLPAGAQLAHDRRGAWRSRNRQPSDLAITASRSAARTTSAAQTPASEQGAPATPTRARTSLAAQGTPVVAPYAGVITWRAYQARERVLPRARRATTSPTTTSSCTSSRAACWSPRATP